MRPRFQNYLLAYISFVCHEIMILGSAAVLGILTVPVALICIVDADSWTQVLLGLVAPFAAAGVGLLGSAVFFSFALAMPLYYTARRINGWPFKPGDRVRVLIGAHCGETIEVQQAWDERVSVYGVVATQIEPVEVWQVRVCRLDETC